MHFTKNTKDTEPQVSHGQLLIPNSKSCTFYSAGIGVKQNKRSNAPHATPSLRGVEFFSITCWRDAWCMPFLLENEHRFRSWNKFNFQISLAISNLRESSESKFLITLSFASYLAHPGFPVFAKEVQALIRNLWTAFPICCLCCPWIPGFHHSPRKFNFIILPILNLRQNHCISVKWKTKHIPKIVSNLYNTNTYGWYFLKITYDSGILFMIIQKIFSIRLLLRILSF